MRMFLHVSQLSPTSCVMMAVCASEFLKYCVTGYFLTVILITSLFSLCLFMSVTTFLRLGQI